MIILLRFLHIVGGALWVGGAVVAARFILPSVIEAGPAGGAVMEGIGTKRKFSIYLMLLMLVTILSGVGLMYEVSGGFAHEWFTTQMAHGITIGAAAAIAAAVVGVTMNMPVAKKMMAHVGAMKAQGSPPTPEQMAKLAQFQNGLLRASRIAAFFLVVAVAFMAIARYL
jgi:uncharacterized membrane protein